MLEVYHLERFRMTWRILRTLENPFMMKMAMKGMFFYRDGIKTFVVRKKNLLTPKGS